VVERVEMSIGTREKISDGEISNGIERLLLLWLPLVKSFSLREQRIL